MHLQVIDHTYRILNINAKFLGSTHDSYIWRMSLLWQHLSNTYRDQHEWLLGDSGYPLEPWLITPIADSTKIAEVTFNNLHAKARNTVERAIGLLKACWRCLCKQRMLHCSPQVAQKIINACAGLHNFYAALHDTFDEPYVAEVNDNDIIVNNDALNEVGSQNREQITNFIMQHA